MFRGSLMSLPFINRISGAIMTWIQAVVGSASRFLDIHCGVDWNGKHRHMRLTDNRLCC